MELAFHLRDWEKQDILDNGTPDLVPSTFGAGAHLPDPVRDRLRLGWAGLDRIYMGDEFCFHRLPETEEAEALGRWARRHRLPLALLTPVMSDAEIQRGLRLVERFLREWPDIEVVVNDWGVLRAFRDRFPSLSLSAGRVFNRAFKDPRLPGAENGYGCGDGMNEVLSYSTFRQTGFRRLMDRFGVTRLERDLLPHETTIVNEPGGFASSIYFPWGYVTTGRVCWSASFGGRGSARFVPPTACKKPCRDFSLSLDHERLGLPLFQNGNTVYYRYSDVMLQGMFSAAARICVRLVCQSTLF